MVSPVDKALNKLSHKRFEKHNIVHASISSPNMSPACRIFLFFSCSAQQATIHFR